MANLRTVKKNISLLILTLSLMPVMYTLDIPLDELTNQSNFHCFYVNRLCVGPLEYCNAEDKECRPCTRDVCALDKTKFPLQCKLNCTIELYVAKQKQANVEANVRKEKLSNLEANVATEKPSNVEANVRKEKPSELETNVTKEKPSDVVIENHAYLWFGLFLAVPGLGIVILVIWFIRKQKSKQQRVEEETKRDPESPENLPLISRRQGVDKETQTESKKKDTKECQAEILNINDTTYCTQKLKGTCDTNEDKNRVIQPSASFTQNGVLPNRRKTSTTSTVGNDEQNRDQCRSNLTPVSTLAREEDSVLESTPLNLGPSLGPSTFDHDVL